MRVAFIVPGAIDRVTGGSIYNRHLLDFLSERGVDVYPASVPDPAYLTGLIVSPLISSALAARLAGRRPDLIVIDAWAHPCLLPFILAHRPSQTPRLALIVHQLRWVEQGPDPIARIASSAERAALRSAGLIITVSRFMRDNIEALAGGSLNLLVAPPGCHEIEEVNSDITDKRPGDEVRLLFAGGCIRRKGIEYLVRAISILKDARVSLDIVGDNQVDPVYTRELRCEAQSLGLGQAIRFHGLVSNETLRAFYSRADLFVMPSLYEGYGMVYAEAMRAGLPVIATQGGPAAEIAREGENALLVRPADAESLAQAIGRLASDPEMRARFGRRSRELARELPTWRQTCERVFESMRSLV
ncbi:MAG TPA: glycosyltransferase family 4 protein [Blastocatellia bacterium]|nr:glycosyltransferase family 4 protein [Blastocatellia bacterium]